MSKQFFMQYVPGEWLSDAQVSQCRPATRGIWWDSISAMHGIDRWGQLTGQEKVHSLMRVDPEGSYFLHGPYDCGKTHLLHLLW